jgi:bacillithiol biosynthesis cysteine-adding enzyme BshC
VFWLAGEDHDWDEVNHVHLQSSQASLTMIRLLVERSTACSVSAQQVQQDSWTQVLDSLFEVLQETEFTADVRVTLTTIAQQSASLTDFFAGVMHWLFAEYGLVLLDAADSNIRQLESQIFKRLLLEHEELHQLFVAASNSLIDHGFAPQVQMQERQVHLFIEHEGARTMLYRHDVQRQYGDRAGKWYIEESDLLAEIDSNPARFSNNVLTRPLMQQYLLPVIGTVLGPAELAYWSMLPDAFAHFGWSMPMLIARREFTLIEPPLARLMDKHQISFTKATTSYEQYRNDWLVAQDEFQWSEQFARLKTDVQSLYEPILQQLAQMNEGIYKLGQQNRDKVEEQVQFLEKRVLATHEQQHQTFLRNLQRLHDGLYPVGKKQERVYNGIAYVNRHGLQWIHQLIEATQSLDRATHHLVFLSTSKEE